MGTLDSQLKGFLDAQVRAEKEGHTIGALHRKIDLLYSAHETIATQVAAMSYRQDRHGEAIKKLKLAQAINDGRDVEEDEDTGSHRVNDFRLAQIEREAERKRDSLRVRRTQVRSGVISFIVALAIAGTSGCVGYAVSHFRLETVIK